LEVSSNNLTNICRLLFSLSRKESNDKFFIEDDLLVLILNSSERLDFKANSDSIVYFCGALKNLSGNVKILKELSTNNVVNILAHILKNLSQFVSFKIKFFSKTFNDNMPI
jgi:armadillo repeat-containing protein 2